MDTLILFSTYILISHSCLELFHYFYLCFHGSLPLSLDTLFLFIRYSISLFLWFSSVYFTVFPSIPSSALNTETPKLSESHLFISDEIDEAVQVHPLKLDSHRRKEFYASLDQIVNCNSPLRGIDKAQCWVLAEVFCSCNYDYERGMMTGALHCRQLAKSALHRCCAHRL